MAFSVADLFKVGLLLLNAMCILSERRLLEPFGLSGTCPGDGVKDQLGQVLRSVRTILRWPLIILNILTIVFTLIFG